MCPEGFAADWKAFAVAERIALRLIVVSAPLPSAGLLERKFVPTWQEEQGIV